MNKFKIDLKFENKKIKYDMHHSLKIYIYQEVKTNFEEANFC